MGEIATSKRQITLFYNSDSIRAKKTIAFAKAEGLPIQEVDLLKTKLTGTQIVELADKLSLKVSELVNQKHPSYLSITEPHDFSTDDWIKTIQHNPQIMKQPIALRGNRSILIETPTDVLKI
jgi:arsenate reductase